jgi:hypothetical protein
MKRSGWIPRKTPIRRTPFARGGRLERRTPVKRKADFRSGFDRMQIAEMEDLARGCVMVRDGATYAVNLERLTISWFGKCRECRNEAGLDWSHVLGRGEAPRLVYVPENAIAHCRRCHERWHRSVVAGYAKALHILGPDQLAWMGSINAYGGAKYDQGGQRLANIQWLRERAPDLLREIQNLARLRAERIGVRMSRAIRKRRDSA